MFYLCCMPMLEEAIVNLLLRHNCVVVPSFGGFVAQSSGAVIDMNSGFITPPRKSVLFNKQLVNNDGLLIAYLSDQLKQNYPDAEQYLKGQVASWQDQLKEGKRVSIDKIGHLYLDAERNISFEQDRFFNLLLESYGLSKVHFISEEDVKRTEVEIEKLHKISVEEIAPITTAAWEQDQETEKETAKVVAFVPETNTRKSWKYIAAAALLPFAFYTYWIPVKTTVLESGMISINDFNVTYHAGEGVYQKSDFNFTTTEVEDNEIFAKTIRIVDQSNYTFNPTFETKKEEVKKEIPKEAKKELVQAETTKPVELKKPTFVSSKKSMNYITGCFSDKANAEAMVKTLRERGLDGSILDENRGMYRVSAGGANNAAEFEAVVKKAKSIGYQGWKLD